MLLPIQDQVFMEDVRKEVLRARTKFLGNRFMLAALGEEVGEVNNALIEQERRTKKDEDVYRECVQVAAMALRLAMEGDIDFDYSPDAGLLNGTESIETYSRVEGFIKGGGRV